MVTGKSPSGTLSLALTISRPGQPEWSPMPSQRFFNLPATKRQRFIDVALEEFGNYSYDSASVSRMVKKLGIAKGSVYQYFENKREIYFYLIDYIRDKRLALLEQTIAQSRGDFFADYLAIFHASLEADYSYPLECLFLANISREWNHAELGPVHIIIRRDIIGAVDALIQAAMARGEINSQFDSHLLAFLLVNSTLSIIDYDAIRGNEQPVSREPNRVALPLTRQTSQDTASQIIAILRDGFAPR